MTIQGVERKSVDSVFDPAAQAASAYHGRATQPTGNHTPS
jgi:hypothetical protein